MNKKSIILLVIIIVLGLLGLWATIQYQGTEANLNNSQIETNVNQ